MAVPQPSCCASNRELSWLHPFNLTEFLEVAKNHFFPAFYFCYSHPCRNMEGNGREKRHHVDFNDRCGQYREAKSEKKSIADKEKWKLFRCPGVFLIQYAAIYMFSMPRSQLFLFCFPFCFCPPPTPSQSVSAYCVYIPPPAPHGS